MAKSKGKGKKRKPGMKMIAATNEKPVRLTLPPQAHREFRATAAEREISMAALAKQAILELLERRRRERH